MSNIAPVSTVTERYHTLRLTVSDGGRTRLRAPIVNGGRLDHFSSFELTPAIGREYTPDLQLQDLIEADDDTLRDFAHIISSRGVLFLKDQKITAEEMQNFLKRFHTVAGAPLSSGLHVHPSINVNGGNDEGLKIQKISSEAQKKAGGKFWRGDQRAFWASGGWHSDVSWEKAPADYSILKLVTLPEVGGDTMFASGEALYDRLSPSFAAYLETLEAVHSGETFIEEVQRNGGKLWEGERGSPFNRNLDLTAVHPVVRTNPVTGNKAIFVNRNFTKRIVGVTPFESNAILDFLFQLLLNNHDLQTRVRWSRNDLAIWDNRSVYHSASFDFAGERLGERACSVGEVPFFDPKYGQ